MPLQYDPEVRNAKLQAIVDAVGEGGSLVIRSGAKPVNTAAANAGDALATIALPTPWMGAPANGVINKAGAAWADNAADDDGTAGHFRIYDAGGVCKIQGTVTQTGGGGDMEVDNTDFAAGQFFEVTAFSIADNNG